jgi:D-3-phosphoglycerate dehydrogenase
LIVQWAPITQSVIRNLSTCKVIVRYGIGIDNIDLAAARSHGIAVCNVPNYCIDEVADHTFALAMSLSRQLPQIDRQVRQGVWKIVPPRPMLASRQMTFVTIGCGRIARAVLKRARECKFNLATCDPYLPAGTELPEDIRNLDMNTALKTADILSLHLPLSKDTHHIMNAATFSKMRPTSLLVNTARGGLVDTIALASALENGQIAAAALDVFEREPLQEIHPLRKCVNAVLTSHVSWYSELSAQELQRMAAEEAVRAIHGEPLQNRVA